MKCKETDPGARFGLVTHDADCPCEATHQVIDDTGQVEQVCAEHIPWAQRQFTYGRRRAVKTTIEAVGNPR
jgi:hypothetical protein